MNHLDITLIEKWGLSVKHVGSFLFAKFAYSIMKGVIYMKFKMTNEQIDEINQLLETNGNSLTAFYDEDIIMEK